MREQRQQRKRQQERKRPQQQEQVREQERQLLYHKQTTTKPERQQSERTVSFHFLQLINITGVLNLFVIHSPKSPSLRMARHSTTAAGKYQSALGLL